MNKTDQYESLLRSMYGAIESEYYLEAIAIEYAIIENRTNRLLVHLDIKTQTQANDLSLFKKTTELSKSIFIPEFQNKLNLSNKRYRELSNRMKKRFTPLLDHGDWERNQNGNYSFHEPGKISEFRQQRNDLTHDLAFFSANSNSFKTPKDFKKLAIEGENIALKLDKQVSYFKRYLNRQSSR